MPPEWIRSLRPEVHDAVKSIISRLDDCDLTTPTESVSTLETTGAYDTPTAFSVAVPGSNWYESDLWEDVYSGEFHPIAVDICESLCEIYTGDPNDEQRFINKIEQGLLLFVGEVLNYSGDFTFDEAAFEAAFSEQFEPRFSDREYSTFLVTLKNTNIDDGVQIDFEPTLTGEPDYLGPYGIDQLRIRALDPLEETGIVTHDRPDANRTGRIPPLEPSLPNPAVEIRLQRRRPFHEIRQTIDEKRLEPWVNRQMRMTPVDSYAWQQITEVIEYISTCLRRCLRLQTPEWNIGFERGYQIVPSWQTYRGIAAPVSMTLDFEMQQSHDIATLDESVARDVERLWHAHRESLRPDCTRFNSPLSRFERMFTRESLEDQLIDCVVGLESTVLQGGNQGGLQYRLGIRTAALLGTTNPFGWSLQTINQFVKQLYEFRSAIVHEDYSLDEAMTETAFEIGDEIYSPDSLLTKTRQLFAAVLVAYLRLTSQLDLSIEQINQRIDELMIEQTGAVHDILTDP